MLNKEMLLSTGERLPEMGWEVKVDVFNYIPEFYGGQRQEDITPIKGAPALSELTCANGRTSDGRWMGEVTTINGGIKIGDQIIRPDIGVTGTISERAYGQTYRIFWTQQAIFPSEMGRIITVYYLPA